MPFVSFAAVRPQAFRALPTWPKIWESPTAACTGGSSKRALTGSEAPGTSTVESAQLRAALQGIKQLEEDLRVTRPAAEILADTRSLPRGHGLWPSNEAASLSMELGA